MGETTDGSAFIYDVTTDLIAAKGLTGVRLDDLEALLVRPSYVPHPRHRVVDDEGGETPRAHELDVGGYARQKVSARLVLSGDEEFGPHLAVTGPLAFGNLKAGLAGWIAGVVLFHKGPHDRGATLLVFNGWDPAPTGGGPVAVEWPEGVLLHLRSPRPSEPPPQAALFRRFLNAPHPG